MDPTCEADQVEKWRVAVARHHSDSPYFIDVVRLDLAYRLLRAVQHRLDMTQFLGFTGLGEWT